MQIGCILIMASGTAIHQSLFHILKTEMSRVFNLKIKVSGSGTGMIAYLPQLKCIVHHSNFLILEVVMVLYLRLYKMPVKRLY